ncbi:MAG: hypothetical protein V3S68_02395 [Dehalococcoidia bacterium]
MSANVTVVVVPVIVVIDRETIRGGGVGKAVDAACHACELELEAGLDSDGPLAFLPGLLGTFRQTIKDALN